MSIDLHAVVQGFLPTTLGEACPVCRSDLHYCKDKGLARVYRCPCCRTFHLIWVQIADLTKEEVYQTPKVDEKKTRTEVKGGDAKPHNPYG